MGDDADPIGDHVRSMAIREGHTRTVTVSRAARVRAYWIAAGLVYILLGVAGPQFFLLGFWEAIPYVFAATWLARRLFPDDAEDDA